MPYASRGLGAIGQIIVAGVLLVFVAVMASAFWYAISASNEADEKSALLASEAPYHLGDVVRSRVSHFRGIVTDVWCHHSCSYRVRFYQATMEPVWVSAFEIEAVQ